MITVVEEPGELCVGTLCQLFHEHGKEVVGPGFNLNMCTFVDAVRFKTIRFFVARNEQAEAVGYACFNIYKDTMRAQDTIADCQAIYVKPEHRGIVSIKLIKLAEQVLKADGIRRIYMHVPAATPKVAEMFMKPKMGYKLLEVTMEKEL